MSDLSQTFVLSVGATGAVTVPADADLVGVTLGVDAGGSTASTADVSVAGTSVFATAANVTASGDAGASITSNKLQLAGDSTSKVASAKATSGIRAGMTNQVTDNVTSGIDFWTPVAPKDTVLASVTAGQVIVVTLTKGTGVTNAGVGLLFTKK